MTQQAWRLLTFASAAVTGVLLATAPVVAMSSCTVTSAGQSACTSSRESLLSSEGTSVVLVLAVPAVLALLPVVLRSARATLFAAGALTLAAVVAMASVGAFFLPTIVLAWVASNERQR